MMPASSHLISKNIKNLSSKLKNKLQTHKYKLCKRLMKVNVF